MATLVPLIESWRGDTLECVHHGACAVADAAGTLRAQAGDGHWVSFTRSTLKPLQALPLMLAGGAHKLGLASEQLALLCASHSGEPMHVAQVETLLAKAGQGHKALQCGCHPPGYTERLPPGDPGQPREWDERHHNCSGKHAGFLCWCSLHGQPVANYLAPGQPLQQAIRAQVARAVGLAPEQLRMGIDGCSAPNYAMPLAHLARAYARLAGGARDAEFGEAFGPLSEAMATHPELVSGTGRNDAAFMRAGRGDWISKAGADGVQVVASRSRGQALAIKVADGNKTAVHAATVAALDQLGWLDARARDELRPWRFEAIANAKGTRVGDRRAVFQLERGA